ncbi:radical SAM protein, partial [Mycobacterium ahvazicum]
LQIAGRDILKCMDDRTLQLILLPTEACNFRCIYCYEDFAYQRMDSDVVTGVLNLLSRRAPHLRALHLSWFGGEPLLAHDIVEKILEHVARLRNTFPSLRLFSDMSTNGYLLSPGLFSKLLELGVSQYQVSFDGAQDAHDRKRILASGRGTFDRIWNNLVAVSQISGNFTVFVRVHVASDNLTSVEELVGKFTEEFGSDCRFKIFFRQLSRMGGAKDATLPILEYHEGKKIMQSLSHRAATRSVSHITTEDITTICYAAQGNSFVVRADGRLNKCTVALDNPLNQVGRLRDNGEVELELPKMRYWLRGLESRSAAELGCPMYGNGARS